MASRSRTKTCLGNEASWSLVYFEFTSCPDICPEELDKMSAAVKELGAHPLLRMTDFCSTNTLCRQDVWSHRSANIHLSRPCSRHSPPNGPLCARLPPSPYRTGRRLRDDQGNVQGLRIYISTPRGTIPGDDYLVDHSIFFYFMPLESLARRQM